MASQREDTINPLGKAVSAVFLSDETGRCLHSGQELSDVCHADGQPKGSKKRFIIRRVTEECVAIQVVRELLIEPLPQKALTALGFVEVAEPAIDVDRG